MKTPIVIGVLLIVLGIAGFIYGQVGYTKRSDTARIGPLEVQTQERERLPIPPLLSGIVLAGGAVLVVVGVRRR